MSGSSPKPRANAKAKRHGYIDDAASPHATIELPSGGVSIFAVMTRLANEVGAINLSQGFPDFDTSPELIDSVARYMREGFNQYAPMPGVLSLREALSTKIERLYGRRYDPVTEITVTTARPRPVFASRRSSPWHEVLRFQPRTARPPRRDLSGGKHVLSARYPDYRIDWAKSGALSASERV